jgi:aminoglycoside phosphotransferase (APT) family kinase protein
MTANSEEIVRRLNVLIREKTGDANASVAGLELLPGHAGQSYSFILEHGAGGAREPEKLVLRLAPEGVRPVGTADVVRQARIMASLQGTGVAAPPVRWYDDDPKWFGRPFFVVEFREGVKLALDEPVVIAREEADHLCCEAVRTMAVLHGLAWEPRREAWGEPHALSEEFKRLDFLLDRPTLDPAVVALAPRLRDKLRATAPRNPRLGCVHGDFQWSNCLFHGGMLVALIDWELAHIGATLLDLGWMCLFSDPQSWFESEMVPGYITPPEELVAVYAERAKLPRLGDELRWFRAFSCYRFGVITAFNLMLHRRGKRPDPKWEEIARSGPRLFERGLELID